MTPSPELAPGSSGAVGSVGDCPGIAFAGSIRGWPHCAIVSKRPRLTIARHKPDKYPYMSASVPPSGRIAGGHPYGTHAGETPRRRDHPAERSCRQRTARGDERTVQHHIRVAGRRRGRGVAVLAVFTLFAVALVAPPRPAHATDAAAGGDRQA